MLKTKIVLFVVFSCATINPLPVRRVIAVTVGVGVLATVNVVRLINNSPENTDNTRICAAAVLGCAATIATAFITKRTIPSARLQRAAQLLAEIRKTQFLHQQKIQQSLSQEIPYIIPVEECLLKSSSSCAYKILDLVDLANKDGNQDHHLADNLKKQADQILQQYYKNRSNG